MGRWTTFCTKASRVKELTGRELGYLLASLVMLPFTVVALRVCGFQRFERWLARRSYPASPTIADQDMAAAKQAARMVDIAARYGICRATCLPQALTLSWLLRGLGLNSQLRIGVRKEADSLKAHAWIEWQGRIVNDWPDVHDRFAAFPGAICSRGAGSAP